MSPFQYGSLSGPFGPVVDGVGGILPKEPIILRKEGNFLNIKLIVGINRDEGAYIVGE